MNHYDKGALKKKKKSSKAEVGFKNAEIKPLQ